MFKTISIIVLSVSIFGIIFFLYVKRALKKQLDKSQEIISNFKTEKTSQIAISVIENYL